MLVFYTVGIPLILSRSAMSGGGGLRRLKHHAAEGPERTRPAAIEMAGSSGTRPPFPNLPNLQGDCQCGLVRASRGEVTGVCTVALLTGGELARVWARISP